MKHTMKIDLQQSKRSLSKKCTDLLDMPMVLFLIQDVLNVVILVIIVITLCRSLRVIGIRIMILSPDLFKIEYLKLMELLYIHIELYKFISKRHIEFLIKCIRMTLVMTSNDLRYFIQLHCNQSFFDDGTEFEDVTCVKKSADCFRYTALCGSVKFVHIIPNLSAKPLAHSKLSIIDQAEERDNQYDSLLQGQGSPLQITCISKDIDFIFDNSSV